MENRAVFLSYASQDAEVARRICDALRAAGVEVWFDQSELRGGDAWDAKIRKQIKECALFVPMISANTQARAEGYFRLEWKLAADRSHLIARDHPFLVPVVIDDTPTTVVRVPEEFHAVQWTRLTGGGALGQFCTRAQNLLLGVVGPRTPSSAAVEMPTRASALPRNSRRRWSLATAALALLAFGAWGGWRWWQTAHAPSVTDNSVAVLAFANLSADKSNEYFSDGISEEICNLLGRAAGLRVPATASSFQFKGQSVSPAEIARQLNVSYLLNGSVKKDGDRVRIRAQLINPKDGLPLWTSENYEREIKDVFKVQDEIAGLIARELRVSLRYAAGVNPAQVHPEAFQLYLQGRQAWAERGPGWRRARELFSSAIALDPKFGRAYAGLVDARLPGNERRKERTDPAMIETVELAETALRLAPNSAEAHTARGSAYSAQWDFTAAERSLRAALGMNPSYAHAHYTLASVLIHQGRMTEGLQSFARATDLDPLSSRMQDRYSDSLRLAGRNTQALAHANRAIELDPYNGQGHGAKIAALLALGRRDDALRVARQALELRKSGQWKSFAPIPIILALVAAGEQAEGLTLLPNQSVWNTPEVLVATGRQSELLASLDPEEISGSLAKDLLFSRTFDPIRTHPRFLEFLSAGGLGDAHERAQKWRAANPSEQMQSKK